MKKDDDLRDRKQENRVRDVVFSGLLISMVFVATRFINVRLPLSINGGLIHLGTGVLFIASIVFGAKMGAVAGSFGMGLFDILSGWGPWAPFTFVIRGVMGYMVGTIANYNKKDGNSIFYNLLAMTVGGVWMIIGYYIAEGILYGNWVAPVTSIPGNVIQIVLGAALGLPTIFMLKKVRIYND